MAFKISTEARLLEDQEVHFLNEKIIPNEPTYTTQAADIPNGVDPPIMLTLRERVKSLDL